MPIRRRHEDSASGNPHDSLRSRRTFVREMTLGAAFIGSGAAGSLAAELAEATKGGERKLGVALMGLASACCSGAARAGP